MVSNGYLIIKIAWVRQLKCYLLATTAFFLQDLGNSLRSLNVQAMLVSYVLVEFVIKYFVFHPNRRTNKGFLGINSCTWVSRVASRAAADKNDFLYGMF